MSGVVAVRVSNVRKHPYADLLSITDVGGHTTIFETGAFAAGDLAVFVPAGYLVPTCRPEFDWLPFKRGGYHRVKSKRIRGVISHGLLVPVPAGLAGITVGSDLQTALEVKTWVRPAKTPKMAPQWTSLEPRRKFSVAWFIGAVVAAFLGLQVNLVIGVLFAVIAVVIGERLKERLP